MTALNVPIPQLLGSLSEKVTAAGIGLIAAPFLERIPDQYYTSLYHNRVGITYGYRDGQIATAFQRVQPQSQFVELSVLGRVSRNVRLAEEALFQALLDEERVINMTQPNSDFTFGTQSYAIRRGVNFAVI